VEVWQTPDGLEVLVAVQFVTAVDQNGDVLIYPEGDIAAREIGTVHNEVLTQ
jgi:hypothetical protein